MCDGTNFSFSMNIFLCNTYDGSKPLKLMICQQETRTITISLLGLYNRLLTSDREKKLFENTISVVDNILLSYDYILVVRTMLTNSK